MIYTLTLNPSVDYIVELESLHPGELNRSLGEAKFPGGKGINVSRVLKNLGVSSNALGFVGGFTGKYIEDYLHDEQVETNFVHVKGDSRINIKLKTEKETEINASGPTILEEDFQLLKETISRLSEDDLLVLAGSIPSTLPKNTYEELVKVCVESGAGFIVDAEGDLLKNVLPYHPLLIKPNHHELGDLFDTTITSCEEVIPFGKKLLEAGAKNIIVSMADKGAVLINSNKVLIADVPKGQVKNSVGAGDSMVAGFIAAFQQTHDLKEAFRYSVASGSATAFSLGLCTKEKIEELLPQVQIKEIN
jgi:1-phosphofructokinase